MTTKDEDSGSDSDAYFEKMQAWAEGEEEDCKPEWSGADPFLGEIDEESYFELMNNAGSSSTMFISEDNAAWSIFTPSLLSSSSDRSLMKLSVDARETVKTWLFSRLPSSSKCYCSLVNGKDTVFVDNLSSPTIAAALSDLSRDFSVYVDATADDQAITRLCNFIDTLPVTIVTFADVQLDLANILVTKLKKFVLHWSSSPHQVYGLYSMNSEIIPSPRELPSQYRFQKLSVSDAELINSHWLYKDEGSLGMIQELIAMYCPEGIFLGGSLVSWCLIYSYGALGIMHTIEEHRRNGLAECLLHRILIIWKDLKWGCAPYCYIDDSNSNSTQLFAKLGFVRERDCSWEGYIKPCPDSLRVLCAEPEDVLGIYNLHRENHVSNITAEEAEREGFVSALYSFEQLSEMNISSCGIIAKDPIVDRVVGYALAADKESLLVKNHILLGPLISIIDQIEYRGIPLRNVPYIIVGQLCVAKGYRGMGLVPRMYEAFRDRYSKRFRCCVTDISIKNPRSLRAHVKTGFQILKRFEDCNGSSWDVVLYDFQL